MKDLRAAGQMLVILTEAFGVELSEGLSTVYLEVLSDLDDAAFRRACTRAVRELKWFPKAAELRELAGATTEKQVAEAAWLQVLLCLQRRAKWAELEPDALRALRAIGGSSMVRQADDNRGLGPLRARFVDVYLNGATTPARALEQSSPVRLVGGGS